jgi:hypothetical protein
MFFKRKTIDTRTILINITPVARKCGIYIKPNQTKPKQKKKMKVQLEYRGTLAEPLSFIDKDTGKRIERQRVIHNFEDEDGTAVRVNDPTAQEIDLASYKPPFKKGQLVLVELRIDPATPLKARSLTLATK